MIKTDEDGAAVAITGDIGNLWLDEWPLGQLLVSVEDKHGTITGSILIKREDLAEAVSHFAGR